MPEAPADEFECPVCHSLVQTDWKACPNCGVEFDWDEPAPAAEAKPAAAPAAPERPPEAALEDLQRHIDAVVASAPPAPPAPTFEPLDALEHEISQALSPASKTQAVPPPKTAPAPPPAPSKKRSRRRPGALLGNAGLAMLTAGVGGVLVALNYDTWIRGQAHSVIGSVQQLGIMGMDLVAAAGAVLLIVAMGRLKGKPARSA